MCNPPRTQFSRLAHTTKALHPSNHQGMKHDSEGKKMTTPLPPFRFTARLKKGADTPCSVGYDRRLDYFFMTLGYPEQTIFNNLDQPDRMGMTILRIQRRLERDVRPSSVPASLYADLDQAWLAAHGIKQPTEINRESLARRSPVPYLLTIRPDGEYSIDLIPDGHVLPALVRERLGDTSNRIYANYFSPDSPCRGYLAWCRDDAGRLPFNETAWKTFKHELELGGPICVAMYFDYRSQRQQWGNDEVEL